MKINSIKNLLITLLATMSMFSNVRSGDPALLINLNPPEETPKDTVAAIKDMAKLENDLRIGADEVKFNSKL